MPGWHSPEKAQIGVIEMGSKAWLWEIQEQMVIRKTGKQLKFEKTDPSHKAPGRNLLSDMAETLLSTLIFGPQLLEALFFFCCVSHCHSNALILPDSLLLVTYSLKPICFVFQGEKGDCNRDRFS